MFSRLLFFCILSLAVNTSFSLKCNGKDGNSFGCSTGDCCSKLFEGDKVLDKRCYSKCKYEGCKPLEPDNKGVTENVLVRKGGTAKSTLCLCKGNDCNGASTASFAATALLAVVFM